MDRDQISCQERGRSDQRKPWASCIRRLLEQNVSPWILERTGLRHTEKNDRLENDQQAGDHSPDSTRRLIWHSASPEKLSMHSTGKESESHSRNIIAVHYRCIITTPVGFEGVNSLDVGDHDNNGAGEDQDEGDQAEHPDAVQAHKLN